MKKYFTYLSLLALSLSALSQVEKTVIVEHFTNTLCGTCASRNPALFDVLEDYPQVLHIAYYPGAPYVSCIFHQHNPAENDARTNYYGIYGGTPRVVLQGEVVGFQTPLLKADQLDTELGKTSAYTIRVTHAKTSDDEAGARIVITKVADQTVQSLKLYAVIAEKEIHYAAPNGENLHHEVFRRVLIDEDVDIPSVGDSVIFIESYGLNQDWNEDEIIITAMLQDAGNKKILQAAESGRLDAGSFFINDNELGSANEFLYPNPVAGKLYISSSRQGKFIEAKIYNLTGALEKSFIDPGAMDLSNIPGGIYMVVLTASDGKRFVGRIVKQ